MCFAVEDILSNRHKRLSLFHSNINIILERYYLKSKSICNTDRSGHNCPESIHQD